MNTFKKERLKTYFNVSRMTYFQQRRQDIMRGGGALHATFCRT